MDGTRITSTKMKSCLSWHLLTGIAIIALGASSAHAQQDQGYISPLPELELEFEPLYPQRHSAAVAREEAAMRADAERQRLLAKQREEEAKRRDMMAEEKGTSDAPFEEGASSYADGKRMAPLPTGVVGHGATAHTTKDMIDPSVHVETAPPIAEAHTLRLGKDTKNMLAGLPSEMDMPTPVARRPINLERVSEDVLEVVAPEDQYKDFEKAGISISMHKGVYDSSRQLARAYDALVAGDDLTAVNMYRDIVSNEPTNQEALFGLATTYHRAGSYDLAKPVYEQLLRVNPTHREGLNNFLSLVSEYAPDDALEELEKLAARNPHFSPIHAQVGMLYSRLGQQERAREKLLYAIRLAPHNLVYQYNLAVILDTEGEVADAVAIYKKLVQAHGRGAPMPADIEGIQRRLNFLVKRYNRAEG